ncbi:2-amino-4-hydroxy-6-hydroxymethyldihydropteridine diphosphokinase [Pedobacter changchengzhani]|uniref:2-amino-4-hydroxy-6-hydroxymethyldihydropteridine pyrophosphokinase n=1 Tax=Pedobacter changchengzhani TaxID=2529274 RepID=A0A4R5MPC4_9SPHI|nr:2-amino-4-hydroxy-6-hydroxymethyldihydropteridine diphosphokinase [Pedobacter changchengzhani]TDG37009.1 2-amino-4-hydroxy-6-hydroxymethyldihydropteridine diphosphokinase [Pedobacter changchengzhani]
MSLDNTTAYLLLGGNLGNRVQNLKDAIAFLAQDAGEIIAQSAVYETAAWGKTDQPAFLNQAVAIETQLTALELLEKALNIEEKLGRIRLEKWGERLIDIDLILFGEEIINIESKLNIPHPYMQDRKFVMKPLAEIAPNVIHPILKKTIFELNCNILDDLNVIKIH